MNKLYDTIVILIASLILVVLFVINLIIYGLIITVPLVVAYYILHWLGILI